MTEVEYHLQRCEQPRDDDALAAYDDYTLFQTRAWLDFVARTQGAEVVTADVRDATDRIVGRFTGLIVRRMGLRILGSPLPGWTTSYMGFNMKQGASRGAALVALKRFAFRVLGCVHIELADRHALPEDLLTAGFRFDQRKFTGYEVDLRGGPEAVFANMNSNRRRNIRKAERLGVHVEEASDISFASEFYEQLSDVFAKQGLVPTYGLDRVRALITHLYPTGQLLLLRARDPSGRCIATGVFPAGNGTMYFWGGAAWRADLSFRPNEAIQWYAMRYWIERGVRYYDMGGRGKYKERYGPTPIFVPRARLSRFGVLEHLRQARRRAQEIIQRWRGRRLGR